jgi:hypothetical protein
MIGDVHCQRKRDWIDRCSHKSERLHFPARMTTCPWEINSLVELRFTLPPTIAALYKHMFVNYRPILRSSGIPSPKSVFIPCSVQFISPHRFRDCDLLSDIRFEPNSKPTRLRDRTLGECSSLKSIGIPNFAEAICSDCFYCSFSRHIWKGLSVKSNWEEGFCRLSLTQIDLPSSLCWIPW